MAGAGCTGILDAMPTGLSTHEPVRQSVFSRTSVGREPLTYAPGRPLPRWIRRGLLYLLLALLILAALVACNEREKPMSLTTSTLEGPRKVVGPVCIEEAIDASGSMTEYIPQREQAERELFAFARRALGPDDLLSEVYFAGSAALTLPPTRLASLTSPPPPAVDRLEDGTLLAPAIAGLVAARASGPDACAARALVMITDGLIGDDPKLLDELISLAGYTRMYAVVPAGYTGADRGALNGGHLDSISVYGFRGGGYSGRAASVLGDAKPLDVIFGEILGDLTGQRLARADKTPAPATTRSST